MFSRFEKEWALFLDVDGTLAAIESHPDDVRLGCPVLEALDSLHRALQGALALVSGRSLEALDALLAPIRLPAAGLHGLERRDASGRHHRPEIDDAALARVHEDLRDFSRSHEGAWVEDKDGALALHVRQAPTAEAAIDRFAQSLESALPEGFELQRGKKILEVRSKAHTKGTAVAAFMKEQPFAGRRAVFVGDDVTDEDAFEWVNAQGGVSIKVGPGPTRASERLEDADEVLRWLKAYSAYLAGAEGS